MPDLASFVFYGRRLSKSALELKERSEKTVRLQNASECTLAPHDSAPVLASGM